MDIRIAFFLVVMLFQGIAQANSDIIWDNCYDVTGQEVVLKDVKGGKNIEASFHEDTPTIIWDSEIGKYLSTDSQTFLYAHACAHHSLGHTYALVPENGEHQADCWAANTLVEVGILQRKNMVFIEREIMQLPSHIKHAHTLDREISLNSCFKDPDTRYVSQENTTSEVAPECREVMVEEEYEEIQPMTTVTDQIPCEHCTCLRWGECICQHAFDTVDRQVEERVIRTRFVPKKICTPQTSASADEY